jgi:hypothetical protein
VPNDISDDATVRIMAASNRLRVVQADFADDEESVRKDFLLEEIERALATVVPDQRRAFLEQLQDRFPSWDLDQAKPAKPAPLVPQGIDPKQLKDWKFLVGKLCELAPSMSADDRSAIGDQLRNAGLVTVSAGGSGDWAPPPAARDLKVKMGLASDQQLSPNRVVELVDILWDILKNLDQVAWQTWRQISPQSATRPGTMTLPQVMAKFLAGDPQVPSTVASAEIGRLRKLLAAMISTVGQVGRQFAQDFCGKFNPSQIEDVVKAQGGAGMFGNVKGRYWDQYVKMSPQCDQTAIEHEIITLFAKYSAQLMGDRGV